jgi:hypothetical protein
VEFRGPYLLKILISIIEGNGDFIRIYLTFAYRSICVVPRADSSSLELQEEATGVRQARTGDKL